MSEQWLEARAPGFRNLPEADRRAIFDFSFLWSLFEAQVMDNFASADRIRDCIDEWAAEGTLRADLYDGDLYTIPPLPVISGKVPLCRAL